MQEFATRRHDGGMHAVPGLHDAAARNYDVQRKRGGRICGCRAYHTGLLFVQKRDIGHPER